MNDTPSAIAVIEICTILLTVFAFFVTIILFALFLTMRDFTRMSK